MGLEYDLTREGRLVRRRGSTQKARFVVYRFPAGFHYYYRDDVPIKVVEKLSGLPPQQALLNKDAVYEILGKAEQKSRVWSGHSYVVDRELHARWEPLVRRRRRDDFWLLVDGSVVSEAETTRFNRRAAEVTVSTISSSRRRGYAQSVFSAWARFHLMQDRIPFYSHVRSNWRSRELAASLKLRMFCATAAYD